jgi:hypothetical protein
MRSYRSLLGDVPYLSYHPLAVDEPGEALLARRAWAGRPRPGTEGPKLRGPRAHLASVSGISRFQTERVSPSFCFSIIALTSSTVRGGVLTWITAWQVGHTGRKSRIGSTWYSTPTSDSCLTW